MSPIPCFLDFEASSLSMESYPIEVAWNLEDGTIESHLISPAGIADWTEWDAEAEKIHGIRREELIAGGKQSAWVCQRMNEQLAGRVVYTDAPRFDGRWLLRLFEAGGIAHQFRIDDSDDLFVSLISPNVSGRVWGLVKLWQMKQEARRLAPGRHRAAWDVEYLVRLWELASEEAHKGEQQPGIKSD
jgi:hypothetical protein